MKVKHTRRKRQLIVGLVGDVCAGKSAVAGMFRKLGAWVWDADRTVHENYRDPKVVAEVVEMFGKQVLNPEGGIDAKALGRIVFSDPAKLEALTEKIVFPRTGESLQKELKRFRASDGQIFLLDAPTLFEAGRDKLCDRIVYLSAPLDRRRQWAAARGWDPADLQMRDERLDSPERKKKCADVIIRNRGTLEDLEREVVRTWESFLPAASRKKGGGKGIRQLTTGA